MNVLCFWNWPLPVHFATHSPQDPKCWQRKTNGYAAPPSSFNAMFCSTCGQEYNYVLLYGDWTEVKTLKESSEAFVMYKYKNESGKPYHRLNFFLCEALEFTQTTLERLIESNPFK